METEIFKMTATSNDRDIVRVDSFNPPVPFMGIYPPKEYISESYEVNIVAKQYIIDKRYDRNNTEENKLLREGYVQTGETLDSMNFEKVRRFVIEDPMINKLFQKQKLAKDEYMTQNLDLQRKNSRLEYLLEVERVQVIKLKENIRTLGFFSRIFRWEKIMKEMEGV